MINEPDSTLGESSLLF